MEIILNVRFPIHLIFFIHCPLRSDGDAILERYLTTGNSRRGDRQPVGV